MKIAISAGEESGDILGSDLIDSLRDYKNDIEFIGLGGEKMKEKGLKPLFPFEEISKMGLIEPLFSLKNLPFDFNGTANLDNDRIEFFCMLII